MTASATPLPYPTHPSLFYFFVLLSTAGVHFCRAGCLFVEYVLHHCPAGELSVQHRVHFSEAGGQQKAKLDWVKSVEGVGWGVGGRREGGGGWGIFLCFSIVWPVTRFLHLGSGLELTWSSLCVPKARFSL